MDIVAVLTTEFILPVCVFIITGIIAAVVLGIRILTNVGYKITEELNTFRRVLFGEEDVREWKGVVGDLQDIKTDGEKTRKAILMLIMVLAKNGSLELTDDSLREVFRLLDDLD